MDRTTKRRARARRHAERLARHALRGAGTRRGVAAALERSESTISHEVTDRSHPVITEAFELLLTLDAHPGSRARAFAEAAAEAVELSEILEADSATLVARGLYLLRWENELGSREDVASLTGHGHAEALRRVASASLELATIIDELAGRGVDLHNLFRHRSAA